MMRSIVMLACAAVALAGCSGQHQIYMVAEPTITPAVDAVIWPAYPPVFHEAGYTYVGLDVSPPQELPLLGPSHGGISILYGVAEDGVTRADLLAYLREDTGDGRIKRWGDQPPIVRLASGTPEALIRLTRDIVAIINQSLPDDWQLQLDRQPTWKTMNPDHGEILIRFAPQSHWGGGGTAIGNARSTYIGSEIVAGFITIDPVLAAAVGHLEATIAHELIHTLGRGHPTDLYTTTTVMSYSEVVHSSLLTQLDREAMMAIYGRLDPGDDMTTAADKLAYWGDDSLYAVGEFSLPGGGVVAFGVTSMAADNFTPWAHGPTPTTHLASNPALSGTAQWSGRLIGLTPTDQYVGGDTDLSVTLSSLNGRLDFTNLESWDDQPGTIGTGTLWGDGDLAYPILAFGNVFHAVGGDYGIVTGAFFGAAHEAMGGTLERYDLTAAFGGKR